MPKTVLIVEDNEANMMLYDDLLRSQGYKTLQAKDGMEGLRMARDHFPDLILMDFILPEFSGLEVARKIKDDDVLKKIPVVVITAFTFEGDDDVFLEGGFDGYITKPISGPAFLEMINGFLN